MKQSLLISSVPWPWDKGTYTITKRRKKKKQKTKTVSASGAVCTELLNHSKKGRYFPACTVLIYPTSSFPENAVRPKQRSKFWKQQPPGIALVP